MPIGRNNAGAGFTSLHKEDLETLAGRRGDPIFHAIRKIDLEPLKATISQSIRANILNSTALSKLVGGQIKEEVEAQLRDTATPGTIGYEVYDAKTQAEDAAADALAAQQTAAQVVQDLSDLTAGFTGTIQGALNTLDQDLSSAISTTQTTLQGNIDSIESDLSDSIATVQTTLQANINGVASDLTQNYYTIVQTDAAITALQTTLQSNIDGVSADLSSNYYTKAATDAAISAAQTTLQSNIDGVSADLSSNYYTKTATDQAISAAQTTLQTNIDSVSATLTQDYYTKAATDSAISAAQTTLQANIDDVSSDLSANYYTKTATDSAVSTSQLELEANLLTSEKSGLLHENFMSGSTPWRNRMGGTPYNDFMYIRWELVDDPVHGRFLRLKNVGSHASTGIYTQGAFRPVIGHTYRLRVKARFTGDLAPTGDNLIVIFGRLDGSYNYIGTGTAAYQAPAVPGDPWQTFEHTLECTSSNFTELWRVGVSIKDAVTGTGDFEVLFIRVEDVTELNQLDGSIKELQSLDLTADHAFATMLNELNVDANGKVAGIDSFGSAMADIHGKTKAAYVMRAKAGGQAGELEVVAWDDAEGGGSAISLNADTILAKGTLSADRIVSGATINLLHDPAFAHGFAGWEVATFSSGGVGAETYISLRDAGQSYAGASYPTLAIEQNGTATDGEAIILANNPLTQNGRYIPVDEGEWYDFSFYVYSLACEYEVKVRFATETGASLGVEPLIGLRSSTQGDSSNPDKWERVWAKFQAPAGAAFVQPRIVKHGTLSGPNSFLFIHKPMVSPSHENATGPAVWTPGGATIINGGNIMADSIGYEHLRVGSIYGYHLNAKEVKAQYVDVDEFLDIDAANAGFRMDKQHINDWTTDGVYMGRHSDGQGGKGFGFFIGRTNNGVEEYIRMTQQDGLVIQNANYLIGSSDREVTTHTTDSSISLLGKVQFTAQILGGGGGGKGGESRYGHDGANGQKGGTTTLRLYDGATLIQEWTQEGGNGGTQQGDPYLKPGGVSLHPPLGNGGNGGNGQSWSEEQSNSDGETGTYRTYRADNGQGGRASSVTNIGPIDLRGMNDPRLELIAGAGGAGGSSGAGGGGKGANGQPGGMLLQTSVDTFVPAGPVAIEPTAEGTFTALTTGGSFPAIIPVRGMWLIWWEGSLIWRNIAIAPASEIDFDTGKTDGMLTFVASQTPTWVSSSSNKLIHYKFWAM